MRLKSRYLSTGKTTANLQFSFSHLTFPLLSPPPAQRESSTLCFLVQVNAFFTKYFREDLKAGFALLGQLKCLFLTHVCWAAKHSQILPSKLGVMGQLKRNSHDHEGCWLNRASGRLSCSAENTLCFSWKSLIARKAGWQ